MRRIIMVLSLAAIMAAVMATSALTAFAAANPNANLRGEGASIGAPQGKEEFGSLQADQAQNAEPNFGELVKVEAQTR